MLAIRFAFTFLIAIFAAAQQLPSPARDKAPSTAAEPLLPVIDHDACPGRSRTVAHWKIKRHEKIYSTWEDKRVAIGALNPGEDVAVVAGVNVTRKPDRILVTQPIPALSLIPGDTILRYDYFAEGEANLWVKGVWFNHYNLPTVREKNGLGCGSNCDSVVTEDGVKEWWVLVVTVRGEQGWARSSTVNVGTIWDSGNFDNLCAA
jgi:hypothetical protein